MVQFGLMLGLALVGGGVAVLVWRWLRLNREREPETVAREALVKRLGKERTLAVRSGNLTAVQAADSIACTLSSVESACAELRNAGKAEALIEEIRTERYDTANSAHEALLERLWQALKPGVTRSARKTDEWGDLGFQGKDPATDFRGNGLLGLVNLLYFAENHGSLARRMVAECVWGEDKRQEEWYLFAVTGINLTTVVNAMLKSGGLDRHFASAALGEPVPAEDPGQHPVVSIHCQLYSSLFASYHQLWLKHKPPIMMFNQFLEDTVKPANPPEKLEKMK